MLGGFCYFGAPLEVEHLLRRMPAKKHFPSVFRNFVSCNFLLKTSSTGSARAPLRGQALDRMHMTQRKSSSSVWKNLFYLWARTSFLDTARGVD